MNWNIYIKRSLIWLLIAAGIGLLAFLQYRSAGFHMIFSELFIVTGLFIAACLFLIITRILSVFLQNNFILTLLLVLALMYLAMRYQVFNGNPYVNGYIQKFQEFQENYNNKMDKLEMRMKKQNTSLDLENPPVSCDNFILFRSAR
jgi:hypothetical protein